MSQENQITLRGYVTAEPRFFKTTRAGALGAEVRLGSTPRWLNRTTGEWQEGEPTYYTVKCWRKLAINVKAALHKGDRVLVHGRFTTRTWVDDQQHQRVRVEVEADTIGHDLVFGWTIFNRMQTAPNVPQALAAGEIARADLDGADGSETLGDHGADGLPADGDGPDGYPQDDYASLDADEYPVIGEVLTEEQLTEEQLTAEAAKATAEAVPF